MNERPIGVFDSGLGGLTVLQALADLLPTERLIYFGDTARYPYGSKPRDVLRRYSTQIADALLERDVKMIIVACNSASAAALDLLRERHPKVPIIGVVEPGVRAAVRATRSGRVGVIGTRMTADSKIYELTAQQLHAELDLEVVACPGFVELVESGDTDSDHARRIVAAGLAPLRDAAIDTLVLGCTHYPLLARTIKETVGRGVVLVSSADETAFEVRDILGRTGWARGGLAGPGWRRFLTSGDPPTFRRLGRRFLGADLGRVQAWNWELAAETEG
ncbi:MAG: glutamate racemase [Actinobacteria bacterium]|nr:glutamate racemase [Actinomycetota bacterium]